MRSSRRQWFCHGPGRACFGALIGAWIFVNTSLADPTVWSGLTTSFTKAPNANPALLQNQDHLTANVALTRGSTQGLYNAVKESGYVSPGPTDTQWATSINNPMQT